MGARGRQGPLAVRVKQLRKDADLTQEALARKSGLSLRTVIRVEQGTTAPEPQTAGLLAKALKCSVIDLYLGPEEVS